MEPAMRFAQANTAQLLLDLLTPEWKEDLAERSICEWERTS